VSQHICQIIDGNKLILELCEACANQWNAGNAIRLPDMQDATCYYCSAPAVSGGKNQEWEQKVRGKEFHFTCMTCLENYRHLFLGRIDKMPTDLLPEAQLELMTKAIDEIDEEVRTIAGSSLN